MKRRVVIKWVKRLLLALFFAIMMFPFVFMISTSLKTQADVMKTPVDYIPNAPTFDNYISAWKDSNFSRYFFNTAIISVLVLLMVTAISLLSGYALSRYRFRGKKTAMTLFLMTQIVPSALLIIPLFTMLQSMGLVNSLFGVSLATSATLLAYCSIMMKGFFSNVSVALEEAAWVDGCSRFQAVVYVLLPLVMPGLIATGAYAFVNAWNSFLLPLMFLTDPNKFTVTLGLKSLIGQYTINYGRLAAAGIICLIPAVIMFAYIQKYMVSGLTDGSVKG